MPTPAGNCHTFFFVPAIPMAAHASAFYDVVSVPAWELLRVDAESKQNLCKVKCDGGLASEGVFFFTPNNITRSSFNSADYNSCEGTCIVAEQHYSSSRVGEIRFYQLYGEMECAKLVEMEYASCFFLFLAVPKVLIHPSVLCFLQPIDRSDRDDQTCTSPYCLTGL